MTDSKIDQRCVDTIRVLAADMVEKANSGHPGAPMGMAPIAHVMWNKIMKYNPADPKWMGRDRFVLSNGHGCALQYIMLHLAGYTLSMDDLKQFRQLGSKTPGHPESHVTPGIEVTTGPLGQGISNAVGLALAERHLAATFNKPGFELFNNYTYVFVGDGCLQEGVSGEASSLAGHLGLGKLICIYDDNRVTIDGMTDLSFSEDVPKRYEAYGWHTLTVAAGDSDLAGIEGAIKEAQKVTDKPTIISVKTTIGFGASKAGTEAVHGAPLGKADIAKLKEKMGFDANQSFVVEDKVYESYASRRTAGAEMQRKWQEMFEAYSREFPDLAKELTRRLRGELPADWQSLLPRFTPADKADATRNLSGIVLNKLAPSVTELVGGSADLTPSTKTDIKCSHDFQKATPTGRYIRYGVREHGMVAIGNGLAAYGGIVPYTSTFLNFIEYAYGAVRLSALSGHQQIFVMTHDSIGLGEDGPTHQPIEALALCRATPNFIVLRPADGNETSGAYAVALQSKNSPSVLALTRQNVPHLAGSSIEAVAKGGYILQEAEGKGPADLIIVATGSEVSLALDAAKLLTGKKVRVVSMPSTTLFDQQPVEYRRQILTPGVPVVSVEALSVSGWERYSHFQIGMTSFGASAPLKVLLEHFGFTADKIAASIQSFLEQAAALSSAPFGLLPTHLGAVKARL